MFVCKFCVDCFQHIWVNNKENSLLDCMLEFFAFIFFNLKVSRYTFIFDSSLQTYIRTVGTGGWVSRGECTNSYFLEAGHKANILAYTIHQDFPDLNILVHTLLN